MNEHVVELTRARWRGLVRRVERVTLTPVGTTRIAIVVTEADEVLRSSDRVYERDVDRDKAMRKLEEDFAAMGYRRDKADRNAA